MIRLTVADALPALARVAGATGMNPSNPQVLSYLNLAVQELMDEGDWPSLIARMKFKITGGRMIIPSEFDRVLYLNVNGTPVQMHSPYFEYVGEGPDLITSSNGAPPIDQTSIDLLQYLVGALDKEVVATFEDIPSDGTIYYPVVYGTVDERVNGVRPNILLQGYDQNGVWVRSRDNTGAWIDGINIPINGDTAPYAFQSPQAFSVITGAQKPVTNGYVSVYASNGTMPQTFLVTYAPYDTRPYYRHYFLPGLSTSQTYCINARLRRRYTAAVSNNDFLLITNIPALTAMMQAIYYREAKDPQSYAIYKQMAVDILKREAKSYIGQQRQKPLITMGEGMGVRRDGMLIL